MRTLGLLLAVGLALGASAAPASASPHPTSGDPSVLSGRTLGIGEAALWFDAGFPGVRATAIVAPSSRVNLGVRGAFLYGSPIMGVGTAIGGGFDMPIRILVYAHDRLDLAILLQPRMVLGQGRLVGQEDFFTDDFGFAFSAEAGARLGFQVVEAVTLAAGLGVEGGAARSPAADQTDGFGVFTVMAGLEAQLSRSTLLTVELTTGYGAARDTLFHGHGVIRLFAGAAFLL